jgi:hypothetical protein
VGLTQRSLGVKHKGASQTETEAKNYGTNTDPQNKEASKIYNLNNESEVHNTYVLCFQG